LNIDGIVWLDAVEQKCLVKHRLRREEVAEVFSNEPKINFVERGQRVGEHLYLPRGRTDSGRCLMVFFIHKLDGSALIVSGRDMSQRERRAYGSA
jgi:hypothetical protein